MFIICNRKQTLYNIIKKTKRPLTSEYALKLRLLLRERNSVKVNLVKILIKPGLINANLIFVSLVVILTLILFTNKRNLFVVKNVNAILFLRMKTICGNPVYRFLSPL